MARNGELSGKQKRMIAALLSSPTIGAACEATGVSRTTLARWLRTEEFTHQLRLAEGEAIGEAARGLLSDLLANHDTLRTVRDNPGIPAAIRVRAAVELDAAALRWHQNKSIEERLAELERRIFGGSNGQD